MEAALATDAKQEATGGLTEGGDCRLQRGSPCFSMAPTTPLQISEHWLQREIANASGQPSPVSPSTASNSSSHAFAMTMQERRWRRRELQQSLHLPPSLEGEVTKPLWLKVIRLCDENNKKEAQAHANTCLSQNGMHASRMHANWILPPGNKQAWPVHLGPISKYTDTDVRVWPGTGMV